MISPKYRKIYAAVRKIPEGRVATYGQIAALAGLPGQPRLVGYALHNCAADDDVPWHRVINARGEISLRAAAEGSEALQRVLLEAEGVRFDAKHRVDLDAYRWDPDAGSSLAD